jgi:hypothetical protein
MAKIQKPIYGKYPKTNLWQKSKNQLLAHNQLLAQSQSMHVHMTQTHFKMLSPAFC